MANVNSILGFMNVGTKTRVLYNFQALSHIRLVLYNNWESKLAEDRPCLISSYLSGAVC